MIHYVNVNGFVGEENWTERGYLQAGATIQDGKDFCEDITGKLMWHVSEGGRRWMGYQLPKGPQWRMAWMDPGVHRVALILKEDDRDA